MCLVFVHDTGGNFEGKAFFIQAYWLFFSFPFLDGWRHIDLEVGVHGLQTSLGLLLGLLNISWISWASNVVRVDSRLHLKLMNIEMLKDMGIKEKV